MKINEEMSELKTDVRWIREKLDCLDKQFASKWIEKPVLFVMVGVAGWVLTQILNLIQSVQAFF